MVAFLASCVMLQSLGFVVKAVCSQKVVLSREVTWLDLVLERVPIVAQKVINPPSTHEDVGLDPFVQWVKDPMLPWAVVWATDVLKEVPLPSQHLLVKGLW